MLEVLVPVAATAVLTSVGWAFSKGIGAGIKAIHEGTKFRTSLSMGLDLIAKELSQFRNDINRAMEQENAARLVEREEYKQTHQNFDKRISSTELLLARHDERLTQVEDQMRAHQD